MPPAPSKKAEALKAETKKLEEHAKRKIQHINKTGKTQEEEAKKEMKLVTVELEKVKKKAFEVKSGNEQPTGWDEQAVKIDDRMKQIVEEEARQQHNLLLIADELANELELKAKPIRKDLPLVSDFSEEDRVHLLATIDKSIQKVLEKKAAIAAEEAKLNRQMQVLMENTPDPTEGMEDIMAKLQVSHDVITGANDPDRARDDLLKALSSFGTVKPNPQGQGQNKKAQPVLAAHKPSQARDTATGHAGPAAPVPRNSSPNTTIPAHPSTGPSKAAPPSDSKPKP